MKAKVAYVYNLVKLAFGVFLELVWEVFFPKKCFGCGKPGFDFCPSCELNIPNFSLEICVVCQKYSPKGFTHLLCSTPHTPERFYSPFCYKGSLRKAILNSKYKGYYKALDKPIELFLEDIKEAGLEFGQDALVIPIPLFITRYLKRGYNQAEYIAEAFCKEFGLKIVCNALKRAYPTKKQASLSKKQRLENLKDALFVAENKKMEILGKDIILIDDIETTGATMLSASKALKVAGCRYIYCISLAKD